EVGLHGDARRIVHTGAGCGQGFGYLYRLGIRGRESGRRVERLLGFAVERMRAELRSHVDFAGPQTGRARRTVLTADHPRLPVLDDEAMHLAVCLGSEHGNCAEITFDGAAIVGIVRSADRHLTLVARDDQLCVRSERIEALELQGGVRTLERYA